MKCHKVLPNKCQSRCDNSLMPELNKPHIFDSFERVLHRALLDKGDRESFVQICRVFSRQRSIDTL